MSMDHKVHIQEPPNYWNALEQKHKPLKCMASLSIKGKQTINETNPRKHASCNEQPHRR